MFYKSIKTITDCEFIEKKSRFICVLSPVTNTDEAETMLANVRGQYPGATHYCYAWRIRGDCTLTERYNDDGEPSSTAGIPMLNVLKMQEIENVMAVVVRYFGGILLGTGGLVRAYSHAVIQTLERADIIVLKYSWRLRITLDYSYYSNFQNKCLTYFIKITDTGFSDQVIIDAWIAQDQLEKLISTLDKITERSAVVEYIKQDFVAG